MEGVGERVEVGGTSTDLGWRDPDAVKVVQHEAEVVAK